MSTKLEITSAKKLLAAIKSIYPNFKPPKCKLVGEDGNAYAVMGRVGKALERAGYPEAKKLYLAEATSGDYDNLLRASMAVVNDSGEDKEDEDEE